MNQENPTSEHEHSDINDQADSPEADPTGEDAEQIDVDDTVGDVSLIESLQQEISDAKDQALRAAAELQNVQRRAKLDIEKARKFALERFVSDLLPVADNLERAVEASKQEGAEMQAVIEGVELTLKTLSDALSKNGVVAVNPAGEPFDPETSQAMTMVPNPELEPNTVMDVFQKGYKLSDRLVRPAMVVVSKSA